MPRSIARLMPWITVLLVWASLTYGMHAALFSGRTNAAFESSTSVATYRSVPEAVAAGKSAEDAGRACSSLFGSYNWWLFSQDRKGPCGLYTPATLDSSP